MFKVKHVLQSEVFESRFFIKNNISNHMHSQSDFIVCKLNTEYFGKNSIKYLGPDI